ncbi:MAG: 4-hydroxy-tetrahydrodipicolinate reductase [Parachlamydiaceae bacterium]
MKIALLGYGKMGTLLEQSAHAKGHCIVARFSQHLGLAHDRKNELAQADLAIDFSTPSCVLPHLELCLKMGKPLVIGTTGWDQDEAIAKKMVETMSGSCLYAPNFSIGVYLFKQIVAYAATLFEPLMDYDVCGVEYHHKKKIDRPSGTAQSLSDELLRKMPRIGNFSFSSVRSGSFPGRHTLIFDSSVDTVTLTHDARNREGFAQGAIRAAEWLLHKQGFFSFDDMMQGLEISD